MLRNPWTYPLAFVFFFLFLALVVVGASNAVNLTDGLDGLAIGLMIIAAGAMTILTYASGHAVVRQLPATWRAIPGAAELTVFCGAHDGRQPGLPLVQRASGGDFHGRRGLAGAGRRAWRWWRC